jgi:hypothetical protein
LSIAPFYDTRDSQGIIVLVFGVLLGALTILFCCRKDRWREIGVGAVTTAAGGLAIGLLFIRAEAAIQYALAYGLVLSGGVVGICLRGKSNKKDSSA